MSFLSEIEAKICTWEEARERIAGWQTAGQCVVFTNGCFDLLHYGHLHYLAQSRDLGDRLVIGLNAAESVKRLKGAHRPINDEATHFLQMASLACVDLVVGFEEDTPLELIQTLRPDVLVKGGDYQPEQIVGGGFVLAQGGKVIALPYISGYSTTSIEQKILQQERAL
ncbi:MAG: D-glycero-beta-D-manno-heptose 1-phosphate adenylyltransferase [Haliscomenobacter sp.]|nr:D-glycero-beta-D-manno-heptose 1-phosphate adenylyltransferase [Haliscomenobacter sp.]